MNAATHTSGASPDGARAQVATASRGPVLPPVIEETTAVCSAADICIRALHRGEAGALDDVLAGLSPRSRYLRFHSPIPTLTPAMRRVLLDVDGRDHVALAAQTVDAAPGARVRTVGIARLIRDPRAPDEAEVAIAIVDAWHRHRVGSRLLAALVERAQTIGVTRLHGRVLPGNVAVLGLARAVFPARMTRRDDDVIHLIYVLDGAHDWEITMDDILADLTS